MPRYTVTVRVGSKVERDRFEELAAALARVEQDGRRFEREADARAVDLRLGRRFEPVQQVVARIEIAGPGRMRGGVDVRGDGSSEAYVGRLRRRLLERRNGESPYETLRRELTGRS